MKELSSASVFTSFAFVVSLIVTICLAVNAYSTKQDVDEYQKVLDEAIVLDNDEPQSENGGKIVVFYGVPKQVLSARSLADMPSGSVWYQVIEEKYKCARVHSRGGSKKSCSWVETKNQENFGKIDIGQFEKVAIEKIEKSQLGKIKYYDLGGKETSSGWQGKDSEVEGNIRYKHQSLELNETALVTVLGRQSAKTVVGPTINERHFEVVALKGKRSKDDIIKAAGMHAEESVSWTSTTLMAIVSACILLFAILVVVADKRKRETNPY